MAFITTKLQFLPQSETKASKIQIPKFPYVDYEDRLCWCESNIAAVLCLLART